MLALVACQDDVIIVDDDTPAAPRALAADYYAYEVTVSWELAPQWNGEAFRVYSRRITDSNYFFIAEVTSCIDEFCSYQDTNITAGETYEYYVSAISPSSGIETETPGSVEVFVPEPTPPVVPDAPFVVALDNANYLTWGAASRGSADFSHYKVYQDITGSGFLLGETDSEGFLDLLAANGDTYEYFVTAVDSDGHESAGSVLAAGTPRPDYHGEWLYDYFVDATQSGFRFMEDEGTTPVVDGDDPARHFRFETDVDGAWIVAGPGTSIHQGSGGGDAGIPTTALKCGVEADQPCTDVAVAPASGYGTGDVLVLDGHSYVFRVVGDDSQSHYGVIRVETGGFDQAGNSIMIFDWAYQLQAGNPDLVSGQN
jgi:hypothetical protein